MLYRCIDIRKYVKVEWDYKYILYFSVMLAVAMASYYVRINSVCIATMILSFIFVYYANKGDLQKIIDVVRARLKFSKA